MKNSLFSSSSQGFTLVEMLVVIFIIGVLGAIAAPGWLGFTNTQRVKAGNDRVLRAMQEAQSNAKRDKITWQASFRETTVNGQTIVQIAVHPASTNGDFIPSDVQWNSLDETLLVYKDRNANSRCETTLDQESSSCPAVSPWRVQFNYLGTVNGQLGQFTIAAKTNAKIQRCIYVSTLLGALKIGSFKSTANSGNKYCY